MLKRSCVAALSHIRCAKTMIQIVPKGYLFCDDYDAASATSEATARISVQLRVPSSARTVTLTRTKTESLGDFGLRLLSKLPSSSSCVKLVAYDEVSIDESTEIDKVLNDDNRLFLNDYRYEIRRNCPAVVSAKTSASLVQGVVFAPRVTLTSTAKSCCVKYYLSPRPLNAKTILTATEGVTTASDLAAALMKLDLSLICEADLHSAGYYSFMPSPCFVNQYLVLTFDPGPRQCDASRFAVLLAGEVAARPAEFTFDERLELTKTRGDLSGTDLFRVCSYNTLAALYVKPGPSGFFPYCKEQYASRSYRYSLLLTEIGGYSLDIGCFQEVDEGFYSHYFLPPMESKGYEVVFAKKDQAVNEGCMAMFKKSRFQLISHSILVIADLVRTVKNSDILAEVEKCKETAELLLKLPTILQVMLLRKRSSGGIIVVGNTHLYFHPSWPHLKAVQMAICLRQLELLKQECMQLCPDHRVSVLMCGDLNSTPDSGVFELAISGRYPADHPDWSAAPVTRLSGRAIGLSVQHSLNFSSACGIPKYTNYTEGFTGCLDYILVDQDFGVDFVYPMPRHELVVSETAIPSQFCPSDHLPLLCDVKLVQ